MSFVEIIDKYKDFDFDNYFSNVTDDDVRRSIHKTRLDEEDLLNLISPKAEEHLEEMARKANELTNRYFGKAVLLYTPMYIANICINRCAYCSYNHDNDINRKKLTLNEIEEECKAISKEGFNHIIILTGESPKDTPVSYIVEAVKVVKKYFSSITIEIYPLYEEEYKEVIDAGVDCLTVYQETYNRDIYKKVHLGGPKRDYNFRLDAPERGAKMGMRSVNIGALLGLDDFRKELFYTALHGKYIQDNYGDVDVAFSTPRIRPHAGVFEDVFEVSDKNLVQCIVALRIFHPNCTINVSTRERAGFREKLLPLGVNKISAGVSTEVGGHSLRKEDAGEEQFEISDGRSTEEIKQMLKDNGYQPVFKDWERI